MNMEGVQALAAAYIDHFSDQYAWDNDLVLTKRDTKATEWASDKMLDLAMENPEELWEVILEVLKRDPPAEVLRSWQLAHSKTIWLSWGNRLSIESNFRRLQIQSLGTC